MTTRIVLLIAVTASIALIPVRAQDAQTTAASDAALTDGQPVFRSRTNLVTLQVNVFDGRSDAVQQLPQEAFRVYEDGVEQRIDFFADREVPVAVGLAIDNSTSMIARHALVAAGVTAFSESSRPSDEMFTIVFNEHVRFGLPPSLAFTNDRDLLLSALGQRPPGGLTALHDAVIEGLSHLAEASHTKRVLVVLSDGKDNASQLSESNMLYRASQSSALIYTIWTGDLAQDRGNPRLLRALAQRSGGVAYAPRDEREVVTAFRQVAANVRRGYSIGYTPTNTANDGSYRHVKVLLNVPGRKLSVRVRDGYIAPDDGVVDAERVTGP
jgi:VWFA-related protein